MAAAANRRRLACRARCVRRRRPRAAALAEVGSLVSSHASPSCRPARTPSTCNSSLHVYPGLGRVSVDRDREAEGAEDTAAKLVGSRERRGRIGPGLEDLASLKGAITPVARVGTGPGAHTVGRPQRRIERSRDHERARLADVLDCARTSSSSRACPAPTATQVSGGSARCTGIPVWAWTRSANACRREPPPASRMPCLTISPAAPAASPPASPAALRGSPTADRRSLGEPRHCRGAGCTTNPTGAWVTQQARNLSLSPYLSGCGS
jgi:hypothetical protein